MSSAHIRPGPAPREDGGEPDSLLPVERGQGRWRLCVAPMMDWTDRHCRYFHRLLSPHARLYSEMITSAALFHGDRERLLAHADGARPAALQLGGHDPAELAWAAERGVAAGYDEINLNVCCPSNRVQSGRIGACLMREPAVVAAGLRAMRAAVDVPVTVKCRIGVDDQDAWADLSRFAEAVSSAGIQMLAVHARKAWLQGLSPKQNREVPPLDYERVYRLKQAFPELVIVINGGIEDLSQVRAHLREVDGVMLGRAVYRNPWLLAQLEAGLWGTPLPTREDVLARLDDYVAAHLARGGQLKHIARHVLGLYSGQPGGRRFRRVLSEGMGRPQADSRLLAQALASTGCRREVA